MANHYGVNMIDGDNKGQDMDELGKFFKILLEVYNRNYPEKYQPERSKREDSCKHELYLEELKEGIQGHIYRKCKKCNEKLYAECL